MQGLKINDALCFLALLAYWKIMPLAKRLSPKCLIICLGSLASGPTVSLSALSTILSIYKVPEMLYKPSDLVVTTGVKFGASS